MGGEETEVSDDDRGHPARGRELRAGRDHAQLGAARAAHRGLEPLGEGRRPVPRRAGRDLRDRAARRADEGALCGRDRRAGRPPGAAGDAAAAGADRRGRRARDPARRAAPDPRAARLRGRGARRGRHRPDLARPRRHARDRRGRGGHPRPRAREGAVHAAAAARDVRAADRGTAAAPRDRGRARRRGALGGVHAVARGRRAAVRIVNPMYAAQSALRDDAAGRARRGRRAERATRATSGIRLFEIARVYLPTGTPRSAARRRDPRGRLPRGEGRARDAVRGAARPAARSSARRSPSSTRARRHARTRGGSESFTRRGSRARGASSSSTSRRSSPASSRCRRTRT